MDESILIPILVLLPVLGAMITLLSAMGGNSKACRSVSLVCSLVPLGILVWMVANFIGQGWGNDGGWHYNYSYEWLPSLGVKFSMGCDAISLWLMVLTGV